MVKKKVGEIESSSPKISRKVPESARHPSEMPKPTKYSGQASKSVRLSRTSSLSDVVRHTSPSELPLGAEWLDNFDHQQERTIHGDAKGQRLEQKYVYKEEEVAKEVVERTDVIGILYNGNRDRIEDLRARLAGVAPNDHSPEVEVMRQQLALSVSNQVEVGGCIEKGQNWQSSGSFRRLLEKSPEDANKKYIPACVNLRAQQVIEEGTITSTINRSGAISDYRNGTTNLQEMKELKAAVDGIQNLNQLPPGQWEKLAYILPGAAISGIGSLRTQLNEAITERQWVLENQALQDLTTHFAQIPKEGFDEWMNTHQTVSYGRVSMLDGIKPSRQDGQFCLNEKSQMLDMAAIYEVLDGKEIVFDGKGPFMDMDGKIHLPFLAEGRDGKPLSKSLEVIYFNISAQGNIQNEGPQKEINRKALERLEALVEKRCSGMGVSKRRGGAIDKSLLKDAMALRARLEKLRSYLENEMTDGFDASEEAAMLLVDVNSFLSINCFSGKDRTGLLAELITFNRLKSGARRIGLEGSAKKSWLAKCGRQAMSKDGVACGVVNDNTGFKALKLSVPRVSLLAKGKKMDQVKGVLKRVDLFVNAGMTFIAKPSETAVSQLWVA